MSKLLIGLTTTATADAADMLARGLLTDDCAVCVQVEEQIRSYYIWDGDLKDSKEYRLMIKFTPEKADKVEKWIIANHPYEVPQWIVLEAAHVSEAYGKWASQCC